MLSNLRKGEEHPFCTPLKSTTLFTIGQVFVRHLHSLFSLLASWHEVFLKLSTVITSVSYGLSPRIKSQPTVVLVDLTVRLCMGGLTVLGAGTLPISFFFG